MLQKATGHLVKAACAAEALGTLCMDLCKVATQKQLREGVVREAVMQLQVGTCQVICQSTRRQCCVVTIFQNIAGNLRKNYSNAMQLSV